MQIFTNFLGSEHICRGANSTQVTNLDSRFVEIFKSSFSLNLDSRNCPNVYNQYVNGPNILETLKKQKVLDEGNYNSLVESPDWLQNSMLLVLAIKVGKIVLEKCMNESSALPLS